MKPIRTLCAALSFLLILVSVSACGTTLSTGENGLYDDQNDIRYINASTVYEARELGDEYGRLQLTSAISYKLYRIPGIDPLRMLATEDRNIVYASDLTMPTLSEMDPTTLHICMETTNTVYVIADTKDKAKIDELVKSYENAPALDDPGYTPTRNFRVRFESPDHPGFYYTLTYVEYAEDIEIDDISYGRYFLLSLFEGTFAPVDDTIHNILGEDEAETQTDTEATA